MDNIYLAIAGLGMVIVGAAGLVVFALLTLAAVVRHSVVPRLQPLVARSVARTRAEAVSWFAPPPARQPVLVRADRPRR